MIFVKIDMNSCIACGVCYALCEDVYEADEEGKSRVVDRFLKKQTEDFSIGEIVDVDDTSGSYLVTRGHAVAVEDKPAKAETVKPVEADKPAKPAPVKAEPVKAEPVKASTVVKIPFAEVKAEAKKLGVPIKGTRVQIEQAIKEAKKGA